MYKRLYFVFICFLFLYIIVCVRLFFWQVISFDTLKGLAEGQTLTSYTIPAKRGKIFSSNGSPLVINQKAFTVYIEPEKIKEREKIIKILSTELNLSQASISAKLSIPNLKWIPIATKVEEEKIQNLKKYQLDGLGYDELSIRFYPEASMAAHLLGFVGKNYLGSDQGYFGIEGFYDGQLRGRDGVKKQEKDALGNPILAGKHDEIPPENGRDLYLTIDKTIQFIAENKLKEGIDKYQALGGSVVILDPSSGAILAMASFPSYNPSKFELYPIENYKNPVITNSYEPGSTFKVLIMAAAFNEGKIDLETKFNEQGPIEIGGYTINTWNQKYHGLISMSQILEYSSNVGMVFIQKKIASDIFLKYLHNLGFGYPTGIDLQEESSPELRPKNKWYEIDFATASFGQGIAVTPLQMVRAVAAIANQGKLMKPYVVKSIKIDNNNIIQINPEIVKSVFKKEVAAIITEMMISAVDNGETRFLKPLGYKIAGKTGTAQIPISGHYDTEKTIASFVGFAPPYQPKFVMLVTLREPSASIWGSETAAPIFFNIAKDLFLYFGISPSS